MSPTTSETEPVVQVEGVTFRYIATPDLPPVLDDVTLRIERGDFVGLIGPNGGGKTTLLKVILGLLTPHSGRVRVLGRRPRDVSRAVGYVPQHAVIDAGVPATVLDVVLTGRLGVSPWGPRYRRNDREAAREALRQVGVEPLARRRMGELSGGQKQRVLIARALASAAEVLLLDEPTAGVDLHMEQNIFELLHRLNERLPIVLVSHDVGFVSAHVNRVACLNRRLVIHPAGDVTPDVIAQLYHDHGPVQPVDHSGEHP